MYTNILVATDGSEIAMKAVSHATEFAKAVNAKLTAVVVTEPFEAIAYAGEAMIYAPDDYTKQSASHAKTVLDAATAAARAQGVDCDTRHCENRYPYDGIIHTAEDIGADLIVVGSHGRRGVEGLLLGSQAVKLLTHTKIPALVVR